MSKRPASVAFNLEEDVQKKEKKEGKKHSLDSDEEDSGAEEEKNNVLHADDIEGEEDGIGGMEGEITITPFNMKEELEEGHFDTQGHYHWKKEKEIRDGWLDNIDWVKVKGRPEDKYKVHKDDESKGLGDESSSEDEEPEEKFELIDNYKEIFQHMKPRETIAKSLQRLGLKHSGCGYIAQGSRVISSLLVMECRTRTCPEQFMALVEFMERYGDLSRPAPGLQGRINSQRLWEELASNLNSITSGGCKTTDKWKKVWADWKTKTKKKFLRIRRHQLQTGETQGKQSLTSLEERLIIMMGVAAMGDRPGLPDQDDNTPTEETVDQNSFNGYSSDATSPDNGASTKISSAERWKRKKAGIVDESGKIVTRITELANQILTKTGNMDIYQETYEKIANILDKDKKKHEDADLDMYADDFDQKEKATLGQPQTSEHDDKMEKQEDQNTNIVKWEFKWSQDDDAEISGPHSTEQMHKWSEEGYFKTGVWVRKHGEDSQFYSSNRMDFELYI